MMGICLTTPSSPLQSLLDASCVTKVCAKAACWSGYVVGIPLLVYIDHLREGYRHLSRELQGSGHETFGPCNFSSHDWTSGFVCGRSSPFPLPPPSFFFFLIVPAVFSH